MSLLPCSADEETEVESQTIAIHPTGSKTESPRLRSLDHILLLGLLQATPSGKPTISSLEGPGLGQQQTPALNMTCASGAAEDMEGLLPP